MSGPTERGGATLVVVQLLAFIALIVSLYAHRNLVAEQRAADVQVRATRAFEAAEAGLQWVQAQLHAGRVDAACVASSDAAQGDLAARYLAVDAQARIAPRTDAGGRPLRPGCVMEGDAWRCDCSGGTAGAPTADAGATAFAVSFEAVSHPATGQPWPGAVRVRSRGCHGLAGRCGSTRLQDHAAQAEVELLLTRLPALAAAPAAPLTVLGDADLGNFGLRLVNTAVESQGLLVDAGGSVQPGLASLITRAGSVGTDAVAQHDGRLAGLAPARFFHRYFGVEPADFSRAVAVTRLRCDVDCAPALAEAVARGRRLLWVEGDLTLPAGAVLGNAAAPVLIATAGTARIGAGLQLHGLLYAAALDWNAGGAADFIRGAVLVGGPCCSGGGGGAPTLQYDPAVLAQLQLEGSLLPVAGGWGDYR